MKGIRMKGYSLSGRSLFLTLFLSGFAAGVLYITLFGKAAAHETTLMSAYFFSKYQQVEFASEELFWYTLKARMSVFTILWLTGLTVLGTLPSARQNVPFAQTMTVRNDCNNKLS